MKLTGLQLTNFKNIPQASLDFSDKLNCLLGNNGMGKSNLLDAIYYLSFGKSFTGLGDKALIARGETFALMRGRYHRRGVDEELMVGLGGRRKSFKRGGKEYKRLSAHVGLFPAVMVAPGDISLVTGPSDERRRFLDMVIAQGDPRYLDALIRYNHGLEQRNRLLRDNVTDTMLYRAIEEPMDVAARYITTARRHRIDLLSEIHNRCYRAIAGEAAEDTALGYITHMDDDTEGSLLNIFDHNRDRDRILHFTSAGPHRDDLAMSVNAMPVRRTASQGQSKTFTIAMRLAQYEFTAEQTGMKPLLLLDDIFDKLDASRVENIMNVVSSPDFGQIFITDTNRKHLDSILERVHSATPHHLWHVVDGKFNPDLHQAHA